MSKKLSFINLRKTIDEIAKCCGFVWLALRKADPSKKCTCTTDAFGPRADCPRCFGTGVYFTDFLVEGFLWRGVPGVEFATPAGLLSTQTKYAILRYDRPVRTTDFLLDIDKDPDTGKISVPTRILVAYAIQDAQPIRGDNGRVEFWRLTIEERNISRKGPGEAGLDNGSTFHTNLDPGT